MAEELTSHHADAVRRLISENGVDPETIDVIGFHGHTVFHQPDKGITRQIGDGGRLARETGISVVSDLRANDERDVAQRKNISDDCLRIHTVGHDCSLGKMVVSIELARGLSSAGVDAKFIATGQTGMLVEGDGCPIDAVVADFISGAVEKQIRAHQHHRVLIIEGQGSITHPCYSAVTLGLLHGCLPHALIYCYEMGRKMVKGVDHIELPNMESQRDLYLAMANAAHPSQFIGIAINSRNVDEAAYQKEKAHIESEWNLPATDVFRESAEPLVNAARALLDD